MCSDRHDALLKEYGEVSSIFRMLTDIRFKLLAFLPVTAGAAAAVLARDRASASTLAFSIFGFVVTIGLVTYNTRNDQLYDALVGRAAAIERSLGIPDGAFANRTRPWFNPAHGRWKVDHRTAVATIYYATIALWLFGIFDAIGKIAYDLFADGDAPTWVGLIAACGAVGVTALGARLVKTEKRDVQNRLRDDAAQAVAEAMRLKVTELGDSGKLRSLCERLADDKPSVIEARARFLSHLRSGALAHYVAGGSPEWTAAQIVAVITDLPPEWLYDCATSRRREVDAGSQAQTLAAPMWPS
jgi:hypothetical protein